MKKKLIVLSSLLASAPFLALAQPSQGCQAAVPGTVQAIICAIGNVLDTAIPIIIVLGVLYFVWGVVTFVIASDEEAKTTGRNRMIYGIIGLVVIVGMWALVGIVQRTLGLSGTANIQPPNIVPF